jgi:hypothetical protein
LRDYLHEHWPEILLVIVLGGVCVTVFNLNREVGQLSTGQDAKFEKLGQQISSGSDKLTGELGRVSDRLGNASEDLRDLRKLPTAVAVLEARIGQLANGGRMVAETSQHAVGYEPAPSQSTRGIMQCGIFSPESRVGEQGFKYRWELLADLSRVEVLNITAGFEHPIPGTSISAKLVEGRFCEMEIRSTDPTALAQQLAASPRGCAYLTVRDAAPLPDFDAADPRMPDVPAPN